MQQYTVYLYLQTVLYVSGGISTHHQELISRYLQYQALLRLILLPVVNVAEWELQFVKFYFGFLLKFTDKIS